VRKLLNAGYLYDMSFIVLQEGGLLPYNSIIGPILYNIYFDVFDQYIAAYKLKYDRGLKRPHNIWHKYYTGVEAVQRKILSQNMDDYRFKRLLYLRHFDEFIIGIDGTLKESESILTEAFTFLHDKLGLDLKYESQTLVNFRTTESKFLGLYIKGLVLEKFPLKFHRVAHRKDGVNFKMRKITSFPKIYTPISDINTKFLEYGFIKYNKKGQLIPKSCG